jgi:hypothetical protein
MCMASCPLEDHEDGWCSVTWEEQLESKRLIGTYNVCPRILETPEAYNRMLQILINRIKEINNVEL